MDEAHVLVVVKFADPAYNLQIPGKTLQYLGRGKPILGVMGECEAAHILRRSGLGLIAPAEDVGKLTEALRQLWDSRKERGQAFRPDWHYISQFSRTRMAERLEGLLGDIGDG